MVLNNHSYLFEVLVVHGCFGDLVMQHGHVSDSSVSLDLCNVGSTFVITIGFIRLTQHTRAPSHSLEQVVQPQVHSALELNYLESVNRRVHEQRDACRSNNVGFFRVRGEVMGLEMVSQVFGLEVLEADVAQGHVVDAVDLLLLDLA